MNGRKRLAALALAGFALGGCASAAGPSSTRQRLAVQIRELGVDPDELIYPFEPTEEMRRWVREEVASVGTPAERLDRLLRGLLTQDQPLTYDRGVTSTAAEVWETRKANCLSFTHLFVGLAREIGVPVYYLRVADLQSYEKDGDLVVASEHVTAAYGPPVARKVLDFSAREISPYHQTEAISDLRALALFYSNQGADRIRSGENRDALELLETAARLDPDLADAWLNLGVAQRRMGRLRDAEASYRRALEADPGVSSAYYNLSSLLERLGRVEEARALLELIDRQRNRNPFSYLALGDLSLREGRIDEAGRYYRRAQRLHPDHAEPLAALGQWAFAAGRRDDAERYLRKARRLDPAEPRVGALDRTLHPPTQNG